MSPQGMTPSERITIEISLAVTVALAISILVVGPSTTAVAIICGFLWIAMSFYLSVLQLTGLSDSPRAWTFFAIGATILYLGIRHGLSGVVAILAITVLGILAFARIVSRGPLPHPREWATAAVRWGRVVLGRARGRRR